MLLGFEGEKLYEKYRKETTTINKNEVRRLDRPFTVLGKIISVLLLALCLMAIWTFTARAQQWYLLGG